MPLLVLLTLLLLLSCHECSVFLSDVGLHRRGGLISGVYRDTGLFWRDEELMELDRVCGRVGLVVFGIGTQENGAEATWVVVGGVSVPSGTELGVTDRY